MHLEDSFVVNVPLEKAWRFVTSPNDFVSIIPDLKSHEIVDARQFKAVFKVGLGMIKGDMNMVFKFEEEKPMSFVKVTGRGTGPQSTANIVLILNLTPVDAGTELSWGADIVVGGLVASVGARLLESTTKSKVTEIVQGIKRELEK